MFFRSIFVLTISIITCVPVLSQEPQYALTEPLKLWYTNPAANWNEALPVGNGRLGGMFFGGVNEERIQLNEESIWSGGKEDFVNPNARKSLGLVRKLLFEGKYAEAQRVAQANLMGNKTKSSSYQTLGDLTLEFKHEKPATDYVRELDIQRAIGKVEYKSDGVLFTREIFSSAVDQALVLRITANKPGALSFRMNLTRPGNKAEIKVVSNAIALQEHVGNSNGVKLFAKVSMTIQGGTISSNGNGLEVAGATEAIIYLAANTNYRGEDEVTRTERQLDVIRQKSYDDVIKQHIADYQSYFSRQNLVLIQPIATRFAYVEFPTDQRLAAVQRGNLDPHLLMLYYHYGRYLLISSSRPGSLPANLQGIWADGLNPPWDADYHININIQMNYWLAEVTNLSELHLPFIEFLNNLRSDGRHTAKEMYGVEGAVAHFTTDAWHFTEPYGRTQWAMWPMGLAWSAQHAWEHFLFTEDEKFLRTTGYPLMKDAAMFCVNWLVENPKTKLLVSGPSISPENTFKTKEGEVATMVMGPTMDHMIIRHLLTSTIRASQRLNVDESFRKKMEGVLKRLSPTKIGSDGRIMEWTEEFEEPEPGHRHISHLYGLHPGNEINRETPELMKAAEATIAHRLKNGGGHTGWSRAWIVNFFARLHDGDKAHENLIELLRKSTLPNLFDNHPPFQIDGNFGATAGITEMLVQSHTGEIVILPALPSADMWRDGVIRNVCARGGFELTISWQDSQVKNLSIKSKLGNTCHLRYGDKTISFQTKVGETYHFNGDLQQQKD